MIDKGLEAATARLTPARIESVINSVLSQAVAGRLRLYLQTCVHCGLCADACHTYVSRNRDPDFAPVAKVADTLAVMIKRHGRVDAQAQEREPQ